MKGISAHLQRHPQSGILYFRLAVPRRLWAILGKRELKRSLRTARISEAVPLALAAYLAALKLFTQATRGAIMPNNPKDKDQKEPAPWTPEWLWRNAKWRWNPAASNSEDGEQGAVEPDREAAPAPSTSSIPLPPVRESAGQAIPRTESNTPPPAGQVAPVPESSGVASSDMPPDWKKLVIHPDGSMELDNPTPSELNAAKELHLTKHCLDINAPSIAPSKVESITLSKLITLYTAEVKRTNKQSAKTQSENAAYYHLLLEVIGNMRVEKIGIQEARTFKETLLRLPAYRNATPALRDLPLKRLLAMKHKRLMGVANVNKHLERVGTLFIWAVRNGYAITNPFTGLAIADKRQEHEYRERYTRQELATLLDPARLKPLAVRKPFKYWLPWMGAFTGCRINELCQLHLEDIREEYGAIVLDINGKPGRKLKNAASARLVPVHPRLIALGLLERVEELKRRGEVRLFPELKPGRDGYAAPASKWFSRYVKERGILPAAGGKKDFHSLRHTFTDELLQGGADETKVAALLGHKNKTITGGRYGKKLKPSVLKPVIDMLDYDLPF